MATNLLIGYSDIPGAAQAFDSDVTWTDSYANCLRGYRQLFGTCTAGASGSFNIEYDLGSSVTKSLDFVALSRCDQLVSQGTTSLILARTTTGIGGSYTDRYTNNSLAANTGVRNEDFIVTGLGSAYGLDAFRGWRVTFSGGSATTRYLHQLFFGTMLDLGSDPEFEIEKVVGNKQFESDAGVVWFAKVTPQLYRFTFTWRHLTNTMIKTFDDTIVRRGLLYKESFFLYAATNDAILDGHGSCQVKLLSAKTRSSSTQNLNELEAVFEELPG